VCDNLMQAWIHWRDGRPLELLDQSLGDSYSRDEVLRCIQIGLLCVQEDPADSHRDGARSSYEQGPVVKKNY
jgi:hypothetical protein